MSLPDACRLYRKAWEPGMATRCCPACDAWAALLEGVRAAGLDLPLPPSLRARCRALVAGVGLVPAAVVVPTWPLPQLELPASLAARLKEIPSRERGRSLPFWLVQARYALAASLLLTVFSVTAAGDPVALGERAAGGIELGLDRVAVRGESQFERLRTLGHELGVAGKETIEDLARRAARLASRWHHAADDLDPFAEADPESAPDRKETSR